MCSVHVTDPATAHAFYTRVLGLETLLALPDTMVYIVGSATPGAASVLLEPSDHPAASAYREALRAEGQPALVLGVDDVGAEYARLQRLDVAFSGPPVTDGTGCHVLLDDTVGNWVQLRQDQHVRA